MDLDLMFDALGSFGDRNFPDAAFVVEKGATKNSKGETLQKFRHLPHHMMNVKSSTENSSVDLPHLRNALARVNQVKPVSENATSFRARAKRHLENHAKVLLENFKEDSQSTAEQREFIVFCTKLGIK